MRERLNESKAAQIGLVLVLVVAVAFLLIGKGGGGGGAESEESEVAVENGETLPVSTGAPASSPTGMGEIPTSVPATKPLPRRFTVAYDSGKVVALLFVHNGGIDDAYTKLALKSAAKVADYAQARNLADVAPVDVIVVPSKQISRYSSVTLGLNVNQVPALIVMRPKSLSGGVPQASVSFGYQSAESVYVSLLNASYDGPEDGTYHPG